MYAEVTSSTCNFHGSISLQNLV